MNLNGIPPVKNVQELEDYFVERLKPVKMSVRFLKVIDQDKVDSLAELESVRFSVMDDAKRLKDIISNAQAHLDEIEVANTKLDELHQKLQYDLENIPPKMPGVMLSEPSVPKPQAAQGRKSIIPRLAGDHQKEKVPKRVANVPIVEYLTMSEFNGLPKYMKGRRKYEDVNASIDDFNMAIKNKYTHMRKPQSSMNVQELRQLRIWQDEGRDLKGSFYCTRNELKTFDHFKLEKASENLIQILRHCNRIKDMRSSGVVKHVIV